jgi:hypothetical protein
MAALRPRAFASFAVSTLALAVALGRGASWAATQTAAPRPSLTCVVVKRSGFRNGWHNLGGPFLAARACKDSVGFVHLAGVLTGGPRTRRPWCCPPGTGPSSTRSSRSPARTVACQCSKISSCCRAAWCSPGDPRRTRSGWTE